jgi:hypothetical protein
VFPRNYERGNNMPRKKNALHPLLREMKEYEYKGRKFYAKNDEDAKRYRDKVAGIEVTRRDNK